MAAFSGGGGGVGFIGGGGVKGSGEGEGAVAAGGVPAGGITCWPPCDRGPILPEGAVVVSVGGACSVIGDWMAPPGGIAMLGSTHVGGFPSLISSA